MTAASFQMLVPYVKAVDSASLGRAIAMGLQVTSQEPRNLVLNAGRGVALKTKTLTPFVPMERIDTELGVISTPVLSTRGKRKGLPLKSGKKNVSVPDQSLATKIVLARLHPGSKFNRLTKGRWALDRATFSPGAGKVGFWAKIKQVATRMVSARHSSTHFLQSGWAAVYRKLTQIRYGGEPLVQNTAVGAAAAAVNAGQGELGTATLFGSGPNVTLLMENLIGMKGKNAESFNEALHKHGGPALQQGVDEQAAEMKARYLPRWESAMARKWNAL